MPTAVLDLDLAHLPSEIKDLLPYNQALLLIRFKGTPVGKITLPVCKGRLNIEGHVKDILAAVEPELWTNWLHDFLEWDERDAIAFTLPSATVAICTRNRTEDLKRALDALMNMPDDGQEFLVVDNSPSTDDTKNLVALYPNVRYVREDRPGLDIARNRALAEARNEVVAFTDDDAAPDPGWLRALLRNFSHPQVLCVTGLTMPLELETEAQELFERYSPFGKGFRRRVFSGKTGNPLATGNVGAGANMALRRSVLQKVGPFDEALDAGTATQSGGDHEMFARILIEGYEIVYDPRALSWHRHRRSREELHQTIYGYGVGVYALFTRHLLLNRELSVLRLAYSWFRSSQLRNLVKALIGHRNRFPLELVLAELKGCLTGPRAYFTASKKLKASIKNVHP